MRYQAEHRVELSSAAADPAKETTKLWRYLAGQPITKADISEYIKQAELALVMTPGSVEEERMSSAMAYLKDDTRNRLQESRGSDQLRGRVVLVDEHRTTRVSSAVHGQQPCEEELDHQQPTRRADWKPPSGQVDLRLLRQAWSQQPKGRGKAQGKAAKAKPSPQPDRWLDKDCNATLNMQRIADNRWRPLELCRWPEQGALPAKGKECPGLGYKRLRDKPPKAQQQQQQPAEAQ
ncbi:hypothetical protein QJQ45_005756 [Haematococcus lacustris]|nr:hypothetical protein QJQ45_005756 [Haematococcus lacustris]